MRRLRIGDRVLRVRDEGDGAKTPIVCVHGAGASSVIWMDEVRRIAARRRVVAVDLPGHGQSDRWHGESIEIYRDAVGTACAALEIPRAILLGHSMGAMVALACASAWPERVRGLVLLGCGARMPVSSDAFAVLERDFARAPEWLAGVAWSPSTPRELVARWSGLLITADQEVAVADYRAADAFDARPLCPSLRVPTLVLGGADNPFAPPERVRELGAAIDGARVVVIPRAGHFVALEQPELFHAELDRFFAANS